VPEALQIVRLVPSPFSMVASDGEPWLPREFVPSNLLSPQQRTLETSSASPNQRPVTPREVGNRHDLLQHECGRMLPLPSLNHVQLRACSASRFCQSSIKSDANAATIGRRSGEM